MDAQKSIEALRNGEQVSWPENINTLEFAQSLDSNKDLPRYERQVSVINTAIAI